LNLTGSRRIFTIRISADSKSYRQQRIPGSVNVPALALLDPETESFLPLETLRQRFTQAGALEHTQHITYCRAGILACVDAFLRPYWVKQTLRSMMALCQNGQKMHASL
jgi:3-mercaptopyruvate sulfurtransferase SseA